MADNDGLVRRVYSVSEINEETKKLLEQRFLSIFVRGEVSNFSAPRSGHWYFTLKDETGQIRVVMFRQANFRHKPPNLGDELIIGGQLSFYRERGEVQIIANQIRPAGLGDLQQQFEALKKKLLEEGLFEQARKSPIPALPRRLAVVTSPTGAVIQDIARVSARRAPSLPILLVPVPVQGQDATSEICSALERCNKRTDIDLILLARGGGSLEDFVAFNSEAVARAIAESRIPVISGVGHETDTCIADFVADLRAATPSEAAELATAGYQDLRKASAAQSERLEALLNSRLLYKQNQLEKVSLGLKNPADVVRHASQKLDYLEANLQRQRKTLMLNYQRMLAQLAANLDPKSLRTRIRGQNAEFSQIALRLTGALRSSKLRSDTRFQRAVSLLEAINPLSTMTRGYSITFDSDNRLVQSIKQVQSGQRLRTRLKDGSVESEVKQLVPDVKN